MAGRIDIAVEAGGVALLERDRELDALEEVIAGARSSSGAVVLIEGEPGIGKSLLLDSVATTVTGEGWTTLRGRGGRLESELPWGMVRELFLPELSGSSPERLAWLSSGAAGLAAPAIGPSLGPRKLPPDADPAASALHGLYWLCSHLSELAPLALLVDDLHWCDLPSLRFLAYLSRRLGDLPLVLALASRPLGEGARGELLEPIRAEARLVRPGALSEAAGASLLAQMVGSEPAPEFARACHEVTGGNPFLLHELGIELAREGVVPTDDRVDRVRSVRPEVVERSVLLRLAPLGDAARALARALAVLGGEASLAAAASVAQLSEDEAADRATALAAAAIFADEVPLRFTHPLISAVVAEEIPAAHAARMHALAVDALLALKAPSEEVAIQVLSAEPAGSERNVELLREAAAAALARGAPDAAVGFLRRALREPPPDAERARLLAELGEAEATAGDTRALARLEEALELFDDPRDRAGLLLRLGQLLYQSGRLADATEAFARGLDEAEDANDAELAGELRTAHRGVSGLLKGIGVDELEQDIGIADGEGRALRADERQLLVQHAVSRVFSCREHEEARALASRALGHGRMLEEGGVDLNFSIAVSCLFWSDGVEEAEEETELALTKAREAGDLVTTAYILFGRCQPRYWRGKIAEAAADAGSAVDAWRDGWLMHLPFAGFWQAVSLVELDDLDGAEAALEVSRPGPDADPIYPAIWHAGRLRLDLARGDFEAAVGRLEAIVPEAAEIPYLANPAVWPWRADGAIAAAKLGDHETADRLVGEALERTRRFGAARPIGIALRGAGLVAGGERGLEQLAESVRTLERSPAPLELCRARVDLGAALRRAGKRSEAKRELGLGRELADRLGAVALERRAGEELRLAGARPRRAALSGPASLTPSELRVVELAAGGETNREIAQQLFVSLRTVETHLTSAYRKLEIESRAELAPKLRGGDHDAASAGGS